MFLAQDSEHFQSHDKLCLINVENTENLLDYRDFCLLEICLSWGGRGGGGEGVLIDHNWFFIFH